MDNHDCKLPPITVSSWPRHETFTRIVANAPNLSPNGPEKITQVPEGTVWICPCKTVWKAEKREGELGWHRANIWTTQHELRKAGYSDVATVSFLKTSSVSGSMER